MTDTEVFANRPPAPCPKCGHAYGFTSAVPTYKSNHYSLGVTTTREWLAWECRYCSFEVQTPVVDRKP